VALPQDGSRRFDACREGDQMSADRERFLDRNLFPLHANRDGTAPGSGGQYRHLCLLRLNHSPRRHHNFLHLLSFAKLHAPPLTGSSQGTQQVARIDSRIVGVKQLAPAGLFGTDTPFKLLPGTSPNLLPFPIGRRDLQGAARAVIDSATRFLGKLTHKFRIRKQALNRQIAPPRTLLQLAAGSQHTRPGPTRFRPQTAGIPHRHAPSLLRQAPRCRKTNQTTTNNYRVHTSTLPDSEEMIP